MADEDKAHFEKDRFDATMKLVEFRLARISSRRQHEWKVTVGLWAILAAWIFKSKADHPFIFWLVLICIVLVHIWWIRMHWVRSTQDAKIAFTYQDDAAKLIYPTPKEEVRKFYFYEERKLSGCEKRLHSLCETMARFYKKREISDCEKRLGFLCEGVCWVQVLTTVVLAIGAAFGA